MCTRARTDACVCVAVTCGHMGGLVRAPVHCVFGRANHRLDARKGRLLRERSVRYVWALQKKAHGRAHDLRA